MATRSRPGLGAWEFHLVEEFTESWIGGRLIIGSERRPDSPAAGVQRLIDRVPEKAGADSP
jgi:hypothetical protein